MELLHVLCQEGPESRENFPVPRVILQVHLGLDLEGQGGHEGRSEPVNVVSMWSLMWCSCDAHIVFMQLLM